MWAVLRVWMVHLKNVAWKRRDRKVRRSQVAARGKRLSSSRSSEMASRRSLGRSSREDGLDVIVVERKERRNRE